MARETIVSFDSLASAMHVSDLSLTWSHTCCASRPSLRLSFSFARYLDDLSSLDPELYDGLIKLKQYDGNVEDLALTFTLDTEGVFTRGNGTLLACFINSHVWARHRIRRNVIYQLGTQRSAGSRDEGEPPSVH